MTGSEPPSEYDAVIIGAGHNGLVAGAYLARAGLRVLALERRDIVGGACVTEDVWPGYRVSTAAYLCSLLHPTITRDLELAQHGLETYRRETAGFAPLPDGRSLLLSARSDRARAALEQFCAETPEDVEAYFRFEEEIERVAAVVETWMLREPPDERERRAAFLAAGIGPLYDEYMEGSVEALIRGRFRNPALQALLTTDGLIGTYGGPSTPGTAYVLLHHYLGMALGARGAWGYVRGGMGQITAALAESFRAHGGTIRTGAAVAGIDVAEGRASGVTLQSGERIAARAVLSNADPYRTFTGLLENPIDGPWEALVRDGGASAKINLAVSELPRFTCLPAWAADGLPAAEHLGTVHICPDIDYIERAWDEARQGYPSTEPMIEMYLQTATDSSLTPSGRHILSLFVQYFPYNLAPGLDLAVEREAFADRVIAIVGRYAPNVPASILHRQILTPRDLEARFGLTGGHIFHGDLLAPGLWRTRPGGGVIGARTPIAGLYLAGSGAHPGGCVFGAPGYNAAKATLADLAHNGAGREPAPARERPAGVHLR